MITHAWSDIFGVVLFFAQTYDPWPNGQPPKYLK
jgi:hypothetical protein